MTNAVSDSRPLNSSETHKTVDFKLYIFSHSVRLYLRSELFSKLEVRNERKETQLLVVILI